MKSESNVIYVNVDDMVPKHRQTNISISNTSISIMREQKYLALENLTKLLPEEYYAKIKGV